MQREDWRRGLDFFFFFSESRDSLPLISCTISSKRTRENFYCPAKILYFIQIINKITLDRRDDDEIIIILRRTWRHGIPRDLASIEHCRRLEYSPRDNVVVDRLVRR